MDNAPKSTADVTWIGRSAAELLVKSQGESVDLGSETLLLSRLALGCSSRGAGVTCSSVVFALLCALFPLTKLGPELLCQKYVR